MRSGTIRRVTPTNFDDIRGWLHGLLIRLDDRLEAHDAGRIAGFVDVGEYGVALEWMADALSEDRSRVATDERADMLALVHLMQMDDRVSKALDLCPNA